MVKSSDSPYLPVKSSSIALASVLKKPLQMKEHSGLLARSKSSETLAALSIFRKPGIAASGKPSLKSENVVYNGIGGASKVLQSDLRNPSDEPSWLTAKKTPNVVKKKKKLSALALDK